MAIEVKDTILKICEGAPVNISTDTTSTITSYQWQVDIGNGFVNLVNDTLYSNVNKNTLGINKMLPSLDGLLYRCIANGACNSADTSGTTKLNLVNYPYITNSNLANDTQTVCTNSSIVLNVETELTGNFYTWQANSGSGFVNISNGGGYSGASTNALTITSINNVNNYTFRCIVGSQCYENDTSNITTIISKPAPVITSISPASSSTLCPGSTITITGIVTGDSLVYGWNVNGILLLSDTFPYRGVNTNSLTVDNVGNSATYNLIATNSCGSVVSANRTYAATTSAPPQFNSITDKTIYAPNSTFFSVSISPANYYTYTWQLDNGTGFTDLVNDSTYSFTVTAQSNNTRLNILSTNVSMNGYLYRCIVSDSCGRTDTSGIGTLTILSPTGMITTQPQGGLICVNTSKTFSVNANVSSAMCGSVSYQWQWNFGNGFSPISGATNSTYNYTGNYQGSNGTIRCIVSCGIAKDTSNAVTIGVYDRVIINQQPPRVVVCAISPITLTASFPPNGVTGGYNNQYRWQRGLNNYYSDGTNVNGETISGSNTPSLTIINPSFLNNEGNVPIGRAEVTDGCTGDKVMTTTIWWDTITIPNVTFQLPKKHYCVDDSTFSLSGGIPLGGTYRLTSNNSVITSFNPSQRGPGQYIISYRYTGNNNCFNIAFDTIFVGPSFNSPIVTQGGNDLFSSSLNGNQWYRNGIMLIGENNNFLTADEDGDYYTIVTNNGCSKMSNSVSITVDVSINEFKNNDDWVHLYPNPVDKLIYLSSSTPEIKEIAIYNPLGAIVFQQKHSSMVLDISNLAGGSYIVVINCEKFIVRKRIVKI